MSLGERCLSQGILNVLYGREAEGLRRCLRMGEKAKQAEYTRGALALEAAERGDVPEGCPPRPVAPRVRPATMADLEAMKAEIIAALGKQIRGLFNGNR
jgi:hypothetical protein